MHYPGKELEVFRDAVHWKRYSAAQLAPWIRGDVLEVGAGIGGSTMTLCKGTESSWTCLEPDPSLAAQLTTTLAQATQLATTVRLQSVIGTLADLPRDARFDTVLYIDVLEHIEGDRDELRAAAERLRPGAHLVVLSPAHNYLYSEFDRAIGHFRRYDKPSLSRLTPDHTSLVSMRYLDAVGMAASLANRMLFKQTEPSAWSIQLWDRVMVPTSQRLDPLLGHRLGKTIIAIWQRAEAHRG